MTIIFVVSQCFINVEQSPLSSMFALRLRKTRCVAVVVFFAVLVWIASSILSVMIQIIIVSSFEVL
jgi:hypothetical protein